MDGHIYRCIGVFHHEFCGAGNITIRPETHQAIAVGHRVESELAAGAAVEIVDKYRPAMAHELLAGGSQFEVADPFTIERSILGVGSRLGLGQGQRTGNGATGGQHEILTRYVVITDDHHLRRGGPVMGLLIAFGSTLARSITAPDSVIVPVTMPS